MGGPWQGEGNVISANGYDGLVTVDTKGSEIGGNTIGVGPKGNSFEGLSMTYGYGNQIGGSAVARGGNTIGFNGGDGVALTGESGDVIDSNLIQSNGTMKNAVHLHAGNGILTGSASPFTGYVRRHASSPSADETLISNTVWNNTIQGNTGNGIQLGEGTGDSSVHTYISQNSLSGDFCPPTPVAGSNLWPDCGIVSTGTPGDNCLPNRNDPGPNDDLACPVIDEAIPTFVSGVAYTSADHSVVCAWCTVEVFGASQQRQAGGEGRRFVASVTTDSGGNWGVDLKGSSELQLGSYVTATASQAVPIQVSHGTWSNGSITLDFRGRIPLAVGSTIWVDGVTPGGYDGTFTVTGSSAGSVSYAVQGNLTPRVSGGIIRFICPGQPSNGPECETSGFAEAMQVQQG